MENTTTDQSAPAAGKTLKDCLQIIYQKHLEDHHYKLNQQFRNFHDRVTPLKTQRWVALSCLLSMLVVRIALISKGWDIKFAMITYMLALMYLSLLM